MNKKNYAVLALALIFVLPVIAQTTFQHLITGALDDRAQTFLQLSDSNLMVNGASFSYGVGDVDIVLIKMNPAGQILWSNAYGTPNYDNGEYTIESSDHSIVGAGRSNVQPSSTSSFLYKLDSAGTPLWSRVYGLNANSSLVYLIETFDHGFAATGSIGSAVLLTKVNSNGDTVFTRTYDDTAAESASCLIQLADSGFLICGRQQYNFHGNLESDAILMRTDANGNLIWSKAYGDTLWEEFTSVKQTAGGGFILCGSTTSFGAGDFDILLTKTDSSGNVLWSETFGGVHSDAAYDIHIRPDESFVFSGFTESLGYGHRGDDSSNVFLMKTDSSGTFQWMEVYGDGLQDEGFHSNPAFDGGYLIAAFTNDYILNDSTDMFIVKADSTGISGCHELSVQPQDTMIQLPSRGMQVTQSAGLVLDTLVFIQTPVNLPNDDACLFSGTKEVTNQAQPNVYPNPCTSHFFIDAEAGSRYTVYDISGKQILSSRILSVPEDVNVSSLDHGLYFVRITEKNETIQQKIIIE